MSAYIDLHCHILPGVDEGAKSMDEARSMAEVFSSAGYECVVATPHVMTGVYPNTPGGIRQRVKEVDEVLEKSNIPLKIVPGAEYYWDFEFYKLLEGDGLQTINDGGKYVLVEFPFLGFPQGIEEVSFTMGLKGIKPLLAHPERYSEVIRDFRKALLLVRWGFSLQVDLLSLGGAHGTDIKRTAEQLVKSGSVHTAVADSHSPDQVRGALTAGIQNLKKIAGAEGVERLLHVHPLAVIEGRDLGAGL